MITDQKIDDTIGEVRRLAGKLGWPREEEGQLELVRVARDNAQGAAHLKSVITAISEQWERCPDARKLKLALQAAELSDVIACEFGMPYPRKII